MKKMKYLRTWLVAALVVTIIGSLTGGTVAWFTDSVESTENLIKSGILDIKLYAADVDTYNDGYSSDTGFAWAETHEVKDGSAALFTYDLWEPGYAEVRYLKIENAGNLALKYKFGINPSSVTTGADDTANLADVIDVYVLDGGAPITRDSLTEDKIAGTITDLMAEDAKAFEGVLLPVEGSDDVHEDSSPIGSVEKVIVLKMQETAGNEYQNCSLSNVGIKLEAAQYMWENDSFDHTYDEKAEYGDSDLPTADVSEMGSEELETVSFFTQNTNLLRSLDTGYVFKTTETYDEALLNPYAKWHADFVVSLDKEVPAMSLGLAGRYETYKNGAWIGFDLTQEIIDEAGANDNGNLPATTEFRLLDAFGVSMNYEELCLLVQEFKCGAYAIEDAANGVKMTVQLRLYEVEEPSESNGNSWNTETGKYITAGTFSYTFGE